jgi:hypothetical protein
MGRERTDESKGSMSDYRRVLSEPSAVEKLTGALESSGASLALGQLLECAARCGVAIVRADATSRWDAFTVDELQEVQDCLRHARRPLGPREADAGAVESEVAAELERRRA